MEFLTALVARGSATFPLVSSLRLPLRPAAILNPMLCRGVLIFLARAVSLFSRCRFLPFLIGSLFAIPDLSGSRALGMGDSGN